MYVYHCKCCGKLFPSTVPGLISCPLCGREYFDASTEGHLALYSAVERLEGDEESSYWAKNPAAVPIHDPEVPL